MSMSATMSGSRDSNSKRCGRTTRTEFRLCLLCRRRTPAGGTLVKAAASLAGGPSFQIQDDVERLYSLWSENCITSLCTLLHISSSHPFWHFLLNGSYCQDCNQVLRDIDFTVRQIANLKKQLDGFRQDINAKVEGNFSAVPSSSKKQFTMKYSDLVIKSKKLYGKKFSYDEVVGMLLEKIRNEDLIDDENLEDTTSHLKQKDCSRCRAIEREQSKYPIRVRIKKGCDVQDGKLTNTNTGCPADSRDNDNAVIQDIDIDALSDNFDDDDAVGADDPDWDDSEYDSVLDGTGESLKTRAEAKLKQLEKNSLKNSNVEKKRHPVSISTPIICTVDECKKVFAKQHLLLQHNRRDHEGDPLPYHCYLCDSKYKSSSGLDCHMKTHNVDQDCLCMVCGKVYKSEICLKSHMKYVHNPARPRTHDCDFCGMKFTEASKLVEHENWHAENTDLPFTCAVCQVVYTNTIDLRLHVRKLHTENLACEVCGKTFRQIRSLQSHKQIHDESFVGVKCEVCDMVFLNQRSLDRHKPKHSTEKKFACSVCPLRFKYNSGLHIHMRKHTGDNPFECKICGRKFPGGHFLKQHEQSHSSIFAYGCKICQKAFKTKVGLYQHSQTHNPSRKTKKRERLIRRVQRSRTESDEDEDTNHVSESNSKHSEPKNTKSKIAKGKMKRKNTNMIKSRIDDQEELQSAISSIVMDQNHSIVMHSEVPTFSPTTRQIQQGYYDMPAKSLNFQPDISEIQPTIGTGHYFASPSSRSSKL